MNDRHHGAADHARHDHLLVARFGAGDAYPAELAEAEQLVRRCAACARLASDIDALRLATAALPAARRTRGFQLTEEQAAGLRGSALQRLLRRLAAPGLAPLRPLAGVAVSVGLVLMVVGVALPTPAGDVFTSSDNAVRELTDNPPVAGVDTPGAQEPQATALPEGAGGQPSAEDIEADKQALGLDGDAAAVAEADGTRSMLLFGGLLIAVLSFAVLSLLVLARWRGSDPLLR